MNSLKPQEKKDFADVSHLSLGLESSSDYKM